jgi:hypothetical protein
MYLTEEVRATVEVKKSKFVAGGLARLRPLVRRCGSWRRSATLRVQQSCFAV